MDQTEIKNLLQQMGPALFQRHGVDLAYLFGSASKGRFTPRSDVDIAVRFTHKETAPELFKRGDALHAELSNLLRRKVDIAVLNIAPPLLRFEVIKNGMLLFSADEEQRALFHIRAFRDYEDFCHAQNFYIQAMKEKLGVTT